MTDPCCLAKRMIEDIWFSISDCGLGNLDRVKAYLFNMLDGAATPANGSDRMLFRRLYVPGLGAGPYFDSARLPALDGPGALARIQEEAHTAFSRRDLLTDHSDLVVGTTRSAAAGWDCLYFRKEFADVEESHRLFPATSAYLRRHRLATEALFSRLAPQTGIEPHSDCANYVTTVHLPLIDSPARIRVAGVERGYAAGERIVFDSSFIHSVENSAGFPRDILLFNVWHPDLSDGEVVALQRVRQLWNRAVVLNPDEGFVVADVRPS